MRMKLSNVVILLAIVSLLSSGGTYVWLQRNQDEELQKLLSVYEIIEQHYYQPTDRKKLFDGAVSGMLKALDDPYSVYMNEEESKAFDEHISSSFVGIGAELQQVGDKIVVVSPIKGSPAEAAGIKPGDVIIRVGDTDLTGMKLTEAVSLIRGEKGTKAVLTIQREGEPSEITITVIRDTIPVQTVYSEMKEDQIGLIQISHFAERTAQELSDAIADLAAQGARGLVIDIRQNPGGLLSSALEMLEMLVPRGEILLQIEYRNGARDQYVSRLEPNPLIQGWPIAVIVDGGTASAGEILAGALQETGVATLVGLTTYGKGSVQTAKTLFDGSTIKYTTAKWLTPSGKSIDKNGIEPDVEVRLPEYADLPYISPEMKLEPGMVDSAVKSMQLMLRALGIDPGRADGYFDDATAQAVRQFQTREGLEATGNVHGDTTRKLIERMRDWIQQNDNQMAEALRIVKEKLAGAQAEKTAQSGGDS